MNNQEQQAINILKKYNQQHIINHMKKLDSSNKSQIIEQIKNIDFEEMSRLYNKAQSDREKIKNKIEPLKTIVANTISEEQKNDYIQEGEKILKQGKFAVVTMSGGQGTRLRT